jgi:ferredoxin
MSRVALAPVSHYGAPHSAPRADLEKNEDAMTFIVTENCKRCRFTDCVAVCPVDCFHADDEMLYIDPDECIDCGACVPACPVEAIFALDETPEKWTSFIPLNAQYYEKIV